MPVLDQVCAKGRYDWWEYFKTVMLLNARHVKDTSTLAGLYPRGFSGLGVCRRLVLVISIQVAALWLKAVGATVLADQVIEVSAILFVEIDKFTWSFYQSFCRLNRMCIFFWIAALAHQLLQSYSINKGFCISHCNVLDFGVCAKWLYLADVTR